MMRGFMAYVLLFCFFNLVIGEDDPDSLVSREDRNEEGLAFKPFLRRRTELKAKPDGDSKLAQRSNINHMMFVENPYQYNWRDCLRGYDGDVVIIYESCAEYARAIKCDYPHYESRSVKVCYGQPECQPYAINNASEYSEALCFKQYGCFFIDCDQHKKRVLPLVTKLLAEKKKSIATNENGGDARLANFHKELLHEDSLLTQTNRSPSKNVQPIQGFLPIRNDLTNPSPNKGDILPKQQIYLPKQRDYLPNKLDYPPTQGDSTNHNYNQPSYPLKQQGLLSNLPTSTSYDYTQNKESYLQNHGYLPNQLNYSPNQAYIPGQSLYQTNQAYLPNPSDQISYPLNQYALQQPLTLSQEYRDSKSYSPYNPGNLPSQLNYLPYQLNYLPDLLNHLPSQLNNLPNKLNNLPNQLNNLPNQLNHLLNQLNSPYQLSYSPHSSLYWYYRPSLTPYSRIFNPQVTYRRRPDRWFHFRGFR